MLNPFFFFLFQGFILKLFSVFKQLCLFQYKYLCTYKMLTVFYWLQAPEFHLNSISILKYFFYFYISPNVY